MGIYQLNTALHTSTRISMKCSSVRSSFIASKMLKAAATATVGAVATAAAAATGTSLIFVFSRDGKCWRRCEPTDTD